MNKRNVYRLLFLFSLVVIVEKGSAQVGIGTTSVNASAKLQVDASTQGFLPPRVALTSTATTPNIITSPATGLLVYNTAKAGTSPNNVTPGYYYYDGSKWQRIINQQPDATVSFNSTNPNTGTPTFTPNTPQSTDYIYVGTDASQWTYDGTVYVTYTPPASTPWMLSGGTTDAGSNKSGTVYRTGSVGIGSTTTPNASAQLDVNSTSRGFLPPRMTSSQRGAISTPAAGLMVYQTDGTVGLYIYDGASWIYIINSSTNVLAVANGGTGASTAAAARTNLGATTVGSNLYTLTDPSAVTFPRFNADNTVSALDAATFRSAIGAGTSSASGTVTSVALSTGTTGTDVSISGSPITSSGTVTINIPDASATARGVITTGTQTIAGAKTFSSAPVLSTATASQALFTDASKNIVSNTITGTGNVVMSTSPTLTTPTIGAATATSINKVTITAPTTSATLTIADGKTLTASNSITLAGTDATTMTFPSSSATLASLAGTETLTNKTISGSSNTITNVSLTSSVTGTLPIANGGTGQTTANASLNALLPSQSGNSGRILQSDGTNTSWATNVALTSAVVGTLSGTSANVGPNASTGSYIDLPRGKWSVQVTMMATVSDKAFQGNYWVRTYFSEVTDNSTTTTDCIGPTLVSALIQGGNNTINKFNMLTGTLIINNTSAGTKRYFYRTGGFETYDSGSTSMTLQNFGKSLWGENSIVAYPMN